MRNYAEHRRQQHAIQRLRPTLDRPEPPRPAAAPTPAAQATPLPLAPVAPSISYEAPRVDNRRRLAIGAARRLGWQPGDTVAVTRDAGGRLAVERLTDRPDAGRRTDQSPHVIDLDRQCRIRLTPGLLTSVGAAVGCQLLVRACEATHTVRLLPLSWVEQLAGDGSQGLEQEVAA